MSIDVQSEVFIERSRQIVAETMFNPKCDRIWVNGLTNVFPHTPGLLDKGSRFERIGVFLNRQFSGVYFVTKAEANNFVEITADEPFQMKIQYGLTEMESGTIAKIRLQSFGENRFNLPATLLKKTLSEKLAEDLKKLKKYLENNINQAGCKK